MYGNLFSMLTVLKGLPLSYYKDLQEDKDIVFKTNDTLNNCLKILDEILNNFSPNKKKMLELASSGYITATDLADYIVKNHTRSFREAYQKTAAIINMAEKRKKKLDELTLFDLKKIDITNYLKIVDLNSQIKLGPFEIDFVTLTHSILEPNGLSITTPEGVVLHTGDWKVDPNPLIGKKVDEKKLRSIGEKGVIAMICDSTNVFSPGRAGSENDVRESLLKIISNQKKRVLVTSFASNVARMESIFYIAKQTKRNISLIGRSMHRIYKAARQCGYLKNLIEPVDPRDASKISRDRIILLCTGSQGEPMGALNRIANDVHPDVNIESGDTVIFSSKIIPGNEKKLYGLQNSIVKRDIEVITEENAFVHVSGHANREDLKDMYQWVKPKCVIPVHGEHRHMKEHINFSKEMQIPFNLKVENGNIIKISKDQKPEIIDQAPTGKVYLDGNVAVSLDSSSIKERKNISVNGLLEITLIITSNGKIKKPVVSFRGIPEEEVSETFKFDLEDEITKTCKSFAINNFKQEKNLIDTIKQNCRKIIKEKTGKRPFTNVNIARI